MQEAIERLSEIRKQLNELVDEGIKLAEENKVTFDLSGTEFSGFYGSGGLRYVPEDSPEADERRENEWYDEWAQHGWLTSSSECD